MLALEPWLVNREATELPTPVRQVEPRAGAGGGRPRSDRAGLPHRHGAATRSRLRLDSDGRLECSRRTAHPAAGLQPVAPDEDALGESSGGAGRGRKPYAGRRRRRRSRRRLGRGGAVRRTVRGRCGKRRPRSAPPSRRRTAVSGLLPLAIKPLAERLPGHDVVLVAGAQVFRYYPHIPGPNPAATRLLHHR